mmetsp:Transcript_27910/g.67833  ORF Transcript_27910/g.67833 Transcript_27910/m.67833 type:complete len:155 (+) Transcript_27910:576-1040(+)
MAEETVKGVETFLFLRRLRFALGLSWVLRRVSWGDPAACTVLKRPRLVGIQPRARFAAVKDEAHREVNRSGCADVAVVDPTAKAKTTATGRRKRGAPTPRLPGRSLNAARGSAAGRIPLVASWVENAFLVGWLSRQQSTVRTAGGGVKEVLAAV